MRWSIRGLASVLGLVLSTSGAVAKDRAWPMHGGSPSATTDRIVNGLSTVAGPTTAWLLFPSGICSGTLIGCQTVLTAAHCFCNDPVTDTLLTGSACRQRADLVNPENVLVFLQNAGLFAAAAVEVHPSFQFEQRSDLAVVKLSAPVNGIAPTRINTSAKPGSGTAGLIAGFGVTGGPGGGGGEGIKREGLVTLGACPTSTNGANHLCWTYKHPVGAPGFYSNTCKGDSGGPLFVSQAGELVLAGVTSGGSNPTCTPNDNSYNADVFLDRAWIQATAGADLNHTSCGTLPQTETPQVTVLGAERSLSPAAPSTMLSFEVPANAIHLVATMNSSRANDYDFYLKRGGEASPTSFDCASQGPFAVETCDIPGPGPGTWAVFVDGISGPGGPFQSTITLFKAGTSTSPCAPSDTTACLVGGRFEVNVEWQSSTDAGTAKVMSFGGQRAENSDSAFYWFFGPTNFEMGLKILDACGLNGKFWVFISGLTNQGWTVRVRDTVTGATKTYSNPLGRLTPTTADTSALSCS